MVVRRPKRRGRYAPLSSAYYNDAAVIAVGLQAEVVYVRSLAFSAGAGQDGFIHEAHARLLCRGVRGMRRTCALLIQYRLWELDEERGGYWVRSWHKWNPSEEDIAAAQAPPPPVRRAPRKRPATAVSENNAHRYESPAEAVPDTDTEATDRPTKGPGRSVAPPDLSAVRARLAEASKNVRAKKGGTTT